MPSPPRPSEAAVRVERLAAARAHPGGWVPHQPDLPSERDLWTAPPAAPEPCAPGPCAPEAAEPSGSPSVQDAGEAQEQPAQPLGTVAGLLHSARVDPGRRGAVALVVVGLVAAGVAGAVLLRGRASPQPLAVPPVAGSTNAVGGVEVVVDVAGKVRRPGLVRLPPGARVDDALKAAGGALPGVSTGTLNLARKLADGEQVLVGVDPPAAAGPGGRAADGLLDLNAATVQDLDGLPGIGPVLADHIVAWRTEHGRFASVDQLREVSGIGEAKYASIKSKVRV